MHERASTDVTRVPKRIRSVTPAAAVSQQPVTAGPFFGQVDDGPVVQDQPDAFPLDTTTQQDKLRLRQQRPRWNPYVAGSGHGTLRS